MKHAIHKISILLLLTTTLATGCTSRVVPVSTSTQPTSIQSQSAPSSSTPLASPGATAATVPVTTAKINDVSAANTKADTMKLRKAEGDVTVKDAQDKNVPVRQNIKLYSGYGVGTEKKSYAWITLDTSRLAKLDAASNVVVSKDGGSLEIDVTVGSLFFNIAEPLGNDESLYIRTSSLAIAIRGTCGWVDVMNEDKTTVSLLQGKVDITVEDSDTGETAKTTVSAGESAVCTAGDDGKRGITVSKISSADVPGYALVDLVTNTQLIEDIYETTRGAVDLRGISEEEAMDVLEKEESTTGRDVSDVQGRWQYTGEYGESVMVISGNKLSLYDNDGNLYSEHEIEPNGAGYSSYEYEPESYDYYEIYIEPKDRDTLTMVYYLTDGDRGIRLRNWTGTVDEYRRIAD